MHPHDEIHYWLLDNKENKVYVKRLQADESNTIGRVEFELEKCVWTLFLL